MQNRFCGTKLIEGLGFGRHRGEELLKTAGHGSVGHVGAERTLGMKSATVPATTTEAVSKTAAGGSGGEGAT